MSPFLTIAFYNLAIEVKLFSSNVIISSKICSQMEGFQEFEARRKKKFDKQIDSNVMIGSKGLDEGVDL